MLSDDQDTPQAVQPEEEPEELVVDESEDDSEGDILPQYKIVSYGADFDVETLLSRLERGDVEIPNFQRGFIWTSRQAARFIESLLMGFPVPGIFLWRNPDSERLVVVDGQQRLRTLRAFSDCVIHGREFKLPERTSPYQRVHPDFQGKTYKTLREDYRRRLDNSTIHATIVNQEQPTEDASQGPASSIYYLFERINTSGTPLHPQEIRSAIYQGPLVELLAELNKVEPWREIFGAEHRRLKDRELIVRFLALLFRASEYARPMKEFINQYFASNRDLELQSRGQLTKTFVNTIAVIHEALGKRAFRPERGLNAAVFDGVMVGVARRLDKGPIEDRKMLEHSYTELLASSPFTDVYTRATADVESVKQRLDLATAAFANIE